MRYLIPILFGFLFAIACINATAQTVTFDTLYFERVNGQLYQITRTEFDNGSYSQTRYAADSLGVLRVYADEIEREAAKLAEAARVALSTQVVFNKSVRLNNSLNTSLQVSPLRELQLKYESPFVNTASTTVWRLNTNERIADVTFTKNATGFLIAKVGADANRTVVLAGQVMRFNNYPTQGAVTFFYKIRDGLWRTLDGNIDIRLVQAVERK